MTDPTNDPRLDGAHAAFVQLVNQPTSLNALINAQRQAVPQMNPASALSYVLYMIGELIKLGRLVVTDEAGNEVTFHKMDLTPLDREMVYTLTLTPQKGSAPTTPLELPDPSALY